jgi:hypothetical protein
MTEEIFQKGELCFYLFQAGGQVLISHRTS